MKNLFFILFAFFLSTAYSQVTTTKKKSSGKLPVNKSIDAKHFQNIQLKNNDTVKSESNSVKLPLNNIMDANHLQGLQLKTNDTVKAKSNVIQQTNASHSIIKNQLTDPVKNFQSLPQEKDEPVYHKVPSSITLIPNKGNSGLIQQEVEAEQQDPQQNPEKPSRKDIVKLKADLINYQVKNEESAVLKYDNQIRSTPVIDRRKIAEKLSINPTTTDVHEIPEFHAQTPENTSEGETPLIFYPVITNLQPLMYDAENPEKGYRAKLSFVLFSEEGKTGQQISNPVTLEFNSSRVITDPRRIDITHLNLPSTDIELSTKEAKDSIDIRIITNSAPEGYTHYLRVNPFLILKTNQDKIQGLGIQEAKFIVQFEGSGSSAKEHVSISSSSGKVEPNSFTLGYNETKTVHLRSQGLDDIKLTASTTSSNEYPIADSNTLVIRQVFPFMFLGFALFGGLLGVVIRGGFEGFKKYPLRMMMGGLLMGLLGSLAYYVLGINLLDLEVSDTFNEFAVLTFSTLCSLILQPHMFKTGTRNLTDPSLERVSEL